MINNIWHKTDLHSLCPKTFCLQFSWKSAQKIWHTNNCFILHGTFDNKYKSLLVKIWFGLNYIYLIFRQYWRYIRWLVCGRFINYSMSIRNKSFFYYCMSCWKMFTFDSRKWTMANWLYYRSKLLKVIYVLKFAIIHLRRR